MGHVRLRSARMKPSQRAEPTCAVRLRRKERSEDEAFITMRAHPVGLRRHEICRSHSAEPSTNYQFSLIECWPFTAETRALPALCVGAVSPARRQGRRTWRQAGQRNHAFQRNPGMAAWCGSCYKLRMRIPEVEEELLPIASATYCLSSARCSTASTTSHAQCRPAKPGPAPPPALGQPHATTRIRHGPAGIPTLERM